MGISEAAHLREPGVAYCFELAFRVAVVIAVYSLLNLTLG
jgi:hypothetical protein